VHTRESEIMRLSNHWQHERAWGASQEMAAERWHGLAEECAYNGRRLARTLKITERHLQRIFASAIGRSPQDWLNEQRLLSAKSMLPTAGSVKEVAYALGFRRTSQFSRDFRRQFGRAPSSFLKLRSGARV
jgi:AraC family transcriptional regulator, regulatory protein of adaptative response / DNA-3-methyladenine glycosylase II